MRHRALAGFIVAVGSLSSLAVVAQTQSDGDPASAWSLPRTPDGHPDFQGFWTTQTFTPLERPDHLADAEQRAAARQEARSQRGPFDGHELRPLSERCIVWPHNGPPMLPTACNDIHQFLQTPDHVVLFTELNNSLPRIIPLDERPPISEKVRLIPGVSRGHWEGDTLR